MMKLEELKLKIGSKMEAKKKQDYREIPIDLIDDPELPIRNDLSPESVSDLVSSIRQVGIIEPLVVNKKGDRFEIIAGHRRLVAANLLNIPLLPCIVRENKGQEVDLIKIHENLSRAEIDPLDLAKFLQHLKEQYKLTTAKVGEMIGRSEAFVSIYLTILTYPADLMEALNSGLINISVARELIKIEDSVALSNYLGYAIKGGITPTLAHQWAMDWKVAHTTTPPPQGEAVSDITPASNPGTFVKCAICEEDIPVLEAKILYVHPACHDKVKSA